MEGKTNTSTPKLLNPKNLFDLKYLGNLNVIDGRILFEMYQPLKAENDYAMGIYQLSGRKAIKFTRGDRDFGMVFDKSGSHMAYQSRTGEEATLYVRDMKTFSDFLVTEIDGRIAKMVWDRSSKGLYMIIEKEKKVEDFRIIESYPLYSDGKGFLEDLSYELVYVDTKGKSTVIMKNKEVIRDFAIHPTKKEIAIDVRPKDLDDYYSRVGLLSLESGSINYLKYPDGEYYKPFREEGSSSIEYFEDGTLTFFINKNERYIDEAPELVLWKDGHLNEVMANSDLSPGNSLSGDTWMVSSKLVKIRGEYVYFVATVRGRAGIYRVNAKRKLEPVLIGDFSIGSFDFDGDTIYYVAQDSKTPNEIYGYDGKTGQISSINEVVKKWKLNKPENFYFKARDGVNVEAWILKGRGKGTVVSIHGGPRIAFGESFTFEAHLMNSMGFSVLYCNPRGSDSYGDDFAAAVVKKYGERDYEDIMDMVKYSIKKYGLDPGRFGVTGGSYGGFMVNWIVGHTNVFSAAISDRSYANAITDYFSGDIGPTFDNDQVGGTPYEELDKYWEKSPIKHMRNCKTPILLIQADADYRCPVWQAYELFTQLKNQGTTTKLVVFKGESHEFPAVGKPSNRVKRLEEITDWFKRYLLLEDGKKRRGKH